MRLAFAPYTPADAAACLALFDANVPAFFHTTERPAFAEFLAAPPCAYLVGLAPDGRVLACGGWFAEPEPGLGGLAWGIVHPDWHGQGLGRQLLAVRLAGLRAMPEIERLVIRTSQFTERFYARAGFQVTRRERDFHAPGIDLVEMRLALGAARGEDAGRGAPG